MSQFEDAIDRTARYAQWGRRYKLLADGELGRRWAEAFRARVSQPNSDNFRLAEEDLFAEHQLRRIRPPYEEVSADRNRLVAEVIAKLKELDQQQLAILRAERTRHSDRSACGKRLERAEKAVLSARLRVAKQREIVQRLSRRHSLQLIRARELLEDLERSLARCVETRDHCASLLWRWS